MIVSVYDDLGAPVPLPTPPRRIVSLVPSLTEAVAAGHRELLVGVTDWCTHPGDLDVRRVRGTKNPDRKAIVDLAPDLVLANKEENRELDVRRLREAGVPVWVTVIESLPQAFRSLRRVFSEALGVELPDWLLEAERLWPDARLDTLPAAAGRVAVPIWRDPWMVVGSSTFTGDLLRRAGLENAFGDRPDRYPKVDLAEIDRAGVDLVLLPDEPYVFTADDGPEAFRSTPTTLASGRLLTWYGPSLLEAHDELARLARLVGLARGSRPD